MSFRSPSEIVLSVSVSEYRPELVWKLLMDISLLTLPSHCLPPSLPPSLASLPLSWKWKNRKISPLGNQTWIVGVCWVATKIWPTNFPHWLTLHFPMNRKFWWIIQAQQQFYNGTVEIISLTQATMQCIANLWITSNIENDNRICHKPHIGGSF